MRLMIAEDSGFFRSALVAALHDSGFDVAAAVADANALLEAVKSDPPDAVILDICLPPTKTDEGLVAADRLAESHPDVGVLVLSAYLAMPHVARLLGDGRSGVGCLAKDQLHDTTMLIDALNRVAHGGTFVDPEFVEHRFRSDALRQVLTERELDILRAVAEGYSNTGIAKRLDVGVKTVESSLTSIFRKLGLDSKDTNNRVRAVLTLLSRPQSFVRMHG